MVRHPFCPTPLHLSLTPCPTLSLLQDLFNPFLVSNTFTSPPLVVPAPSHLSHPFPNLTHPSCPIPSLLPNPLCKPLHISLTPFLISSIPHVPYLEHISLTLCTSPFTSLTPFLISSIHRVQYFHISLTLCASPFTSLTPFLISSIPHVPYLHFSLTLCASPFTSLSPLS